MSMKKLVVCKFAECGQVYNDPRILPCGKRTCAAHIGEMVVNCDSDMAMDCDRKMIKCHFCEEIHSFPENGKGFPVDEHIPHLLRISYSFEHQTANKRLDELTQFMDKLIKFDKEDIAIDYFERVEAGILIDKDLNMQKLSDYYQVLVDEVHKRKLKCLEHIKTSSTLEGELEAIKQTLLKHESEMKAKQLNVCLKTLDGDDTTWREIQAECSRLLETTKLLEEEIKRKIIFNQKIEFKPRASNSIIPIEEFCGDLDFGVIDSTILTTDKMQSDFVRLCRLRNVQLELIYRASRDGFEAASFHAKCDHKPRTLTVFKTTNGNVFGARTHIAFDSSGKYGFDPNAFIFSLINAQRTPLVIPVKADEKRVVGSHHAYGPCFGAGDIFISTNSNLTVRSYSNLGKCFDFKLFDCEKTKALSFLAGSLHFQTTEIEIFQLG